VEDRRNKVVHGASKAMPGYLERGGAAEGIGTQQTRTYRNLSNTQIDEHS
jgi:hypothetical protein